jgi:hypothetical protein
MGRDETKRSDGHPVPIGNVQNQYFWHVQKPSKTPNSDHFGIKPQLGMSETLAKISEGLERIFGPESVILSAF